ncbi:phasin family protein [Paraburkholderia ferrariae]|uniref:Phasin family protein n=2 Tax=Paraburkholderia TaxID=1822464 RepID=A0ABU9S0X7_9BURK
MQQDRGTLSARSNLKSEPMMIEPPIALPDAGPGNAPERVTSLGTEMNELARLYVETAGRIAELNSHAFSTTLNEQRAIAIESASERSPFDAWRLNAGYALAGTVKTAAYWRHINEIMLGAIVDCVSGIESRLNRDFMAWSNAFEGTTS